MDAKALKARENRARHFAKRRGWRLTKSWSKTPSAPDFNQWTLADAAGEVVCRVKGIAAVERELKALYERELGGA